MSLRTRIGRLEGMAGTIPDADPLALAVCVPAGCDMADGRPPGEYPNADGSVVDVVYEGDEPDPATLAALRGRMPAWGKIIQLDPS